MSFVPRDRDELCCRECLGEIELEAYRRFQLCPDCEVAKAAAEIPDAPPSWLDKRAA